MIATPAQREEFDLHAANNDDVDDVMRVMEEAFRDSYGEAWTRSQLVGILPMAGVALVVARSRRRGASAGFSLARFVADEGELLLIAVHPKFQRRGVGKLLLDQFLNHAGERGLRRVHLEVRDGNPAASMYIANRFKPVGRRANYYCGSNGRRHDAITLARELLLD